MSSNVSFLRKGLHYCTWLSSSVTNGSNLKHHKCFNLGKEQSFGWNNRLLLIFDFTLGLLSEGKMSFKYTSIMIKCFKKVPKISSGHYVKDFHLIVVGQSYVQLSIFCPDKYFWLLDKSTRKYYISSVFSWYLPL